MCEKNIDWLFPTRPQPGTWSATQVSALTRNRTLDLSFCRMMPNWATLVRAPNFFIHLPTTHICVCKCIYWVSDLASLKPQLQITTPNLLLSPSTQQNGNPLPQELLLTSRSSTSQTQAIHQVLSVPPVHSKPYHFGHLYPYHIEQRHLLLFRWQ